MKRDKKRAMDNYKRVMSIMSEGDIINGLFESLEEITGKKATEQQREYVNSVVRQHAMRWSNVISIVEQGIEDPEILAKYKQKVEEGK